MKYINQCYYTSFIYIVVILGIHCTGGQKYQVCGNSCSHTCLDLATNPDCSRKCVEGCNCLEGFSLDGDGLCVPITACPCVYDAKEYKTGYEMMQQQADGSYLVWSVSTPFTIFFPYTLYSPNIFIW